MSACEMWCNLCVNNYCRIPEDMKLVADDADICIGEILKGCQL